MTALDFDITVAQQVRIVHFDSLIIQKCWIKDGKNCFKTPEVASLQPVSSLKFSIYKDSEPGKDRC